MVLSTKKGFTLLELIIAMALFSIGLIAVFVVLNSGFKNMAQARGQVVAINLAREGAEMIFNIRDTNIRKWSGKKDLCRLNANSIFAALPDECEYETRLGYGSIASAIHYIVLPAKQGNTKVPIAIRTVDAPLAVSTGLNLSDGVSVSDRIYELMLTSSGEFLSSLFFSGSAGSNLCYAFDTGTSNLLTTASNCLNPQYSSAGRFYRTITNVGLFDKDPNITGGNLIDCPNGYNCAIAEPRELRFCSEVQYIVDKAIRKVTMCSLMTSFSE